MPFSDHIREASHFEIFLLVDDQGVYLLFVHVQNWLSPKLMKKYFGGIGLTLNVGQWDLVFCSITPKHRKISCAIHAFWSWSPLLCSCLPTLVFRKQTCAQLKHQWKMYLPTIEYSIYLNYYQIHMLRGIAFKVRKRGALKIIKRKCLKRDERQHCHLLHLTWLLYQISKLLNGYGNYRAM